MSQVILFNFSQDAALNVAEKACYFAAFCIHVQESHNWAIALLYRFWLL